MRNIGFVDLRSPSLAIAIACTVLATGTDGIAPALTLDRTAIGTGELWRLWSCHVVHYSWRHTLFDASAVLVLGGMAERLFGRRFVATVLALVAPSMSLALMWFVPAMQEYRGASGLATFLGTLVALALWQKRRDFRPLLMSLAMLFIAKTVCEAMGGSLTPLALPPGVAVAWQAHVFAAIAAAVAFVSGGAAATFPHPRSPPPPQRLPVA